MAFADDFTCTVVDYGAWPEQVRSNFTKSDIRKTLADVYLDAGYEGRIRSGIDDLADNLMLRRWRKEGGVEMPLDLLMVDEGHMTPVVYEACLRSKHGSRIIPAKGRSIGPSGKRFEDYERRTGETLGMHWQKKRSANNSITHVVHNPNFWKRFVWSRLRTSVGDAGAMTLFKADTHTHRMVADHLAASEYPDVQHSRYRDQDVEVWTAYPNRDNDLFDCAVGCCVAASVAGCKLGAAQSKGGKKRRKSTGSYAA
jgi:phage terminase large subunit GpA-like protein